MSNILVNMEYIDKRVDYTIPTIFALGARSISNTVEVWLTPAKSLKIALMDEAFFNSFVKVDRGIWTWKLGTWKRWALFRESCNVTLDERLETFLPWEKRANSPLTCYDFEKVVARYLNARHTGQDKRFTRLSPDCVLYTVDGKPICYIECKWVNGRFANNKYNAEK